MGNENSEVRWSHIRAFCVVPWAMRSTKRLISMVMIHIYCIHSVFMGLFRRYFYNLLIKKKEKKISHSCATNFSQHRPPLRCCEMSIFILRIYL